jgi:adenylate cyclase
MESAAVQRRRATLLSADVVGYSRLMANDEVGTLKLWLATLTLIEAQVLGCGGRLVDTPGDNVLAEFEYETDALRCAMRIHRELARHNRLIADEGRMQLRIGVHSGELIEFNGRLYGNTVNIAARLQQAAAPSSVLVSERVAERVEPRLQRQLRLLGNLQLKNIPESIAALQACVGE